MIRRKSNFTILALGGRAWGRAILAVEIAEELVQQGNRAHIITDFTASPLFGKRGVTYEIVPRRMGPDLTLWFRERIGAIHTDALVLCDYESVALFLSTLGSSVANLTTLNVPVLGLDTWISKETGNVIDVFGDTKISLEEWHPLIERLAPVPLARLAYSPGFCRGFTDTPRSLSTDRTLCREAFGMDRNAAVILMATAPWQHAPFPHRWAQFCQTLVPDIIAGYLAQIPGVLLVHVGPASLPFERNLGSRYAHLGTLDRARFLGLLSSSDIFLSFTPASMTQGAALSLGVPVLSVQHSGNVLWKEIYSREELSKAYPSLPLTEYDSAQLYPFSVWPLGYSAFLAPLLGRNELTESVAVVDVMKGCDFRTSVRELAFEGATRDRALARQNKYAERVRLLPSPGIAITSWVDTQMQSSSLMG